MNEFILAVLYLAPTIPAIYLGLRMDKKLKAFKPDVKPYAFGYFLGFLGVLSFPLNLLQYVYGENIASLPNLLTDFLFFVTSIGIVYRRSLAWIIDILATLAQSISSISPFKSFDDFTNPHILFSVETLTLVIMIFFLLIMTTYFIKRRREMSFI